MIVGLEKFFPSSDFCEKKAFKVIRIFFPREVTLKVRRDSIHYDNPLTTKSVGFTRRVGIDVCY